MKKAIIFDWSGVISDDRLPVYEANMRLLEKNGKQRIAFNEWLSESKLNVVDFLADHGIFGKREEIIEEYREIFDGIKRSGIHPRLYEDVPRVLKKLMQRKIKLAVISSHPQKSLHVEAREYGIFQFFEKLIGNAKNKNDDIMNILAGWNIKNNLVSYIGDTVYDVQAAKKTGVLSIAITTGYHLRNRLHKEHPDLIINSLSELLDNL